MCARYLLLMTINIAHRGKPSLTLQYFFGFPRFFCWLLLVFKRVMIFFEVPCPMRICYFSENLLWVCGTCLRACLHSTVRWSIAGFFFLWCEEQVRDKKREPTRCPSLHSHGTQTHKLTHPCVCVWGKILFNISCYSSTWGEKEILLCKTFARAKYTIPQLFKSPRFFFQRCQSGMS